MSNQTPRIWNVRFNHLETQKRKVWTDGKYVESDQDEEVTRHGDRMVLAHTIEEAMTKIRDKYKVSFFMSITDKGFVIP